MTEQNHHDPAELDKLTEKFTVLPNDNPASDAKRAELIDKPAFGQVFSDNMAHMTWTKGEGWGDRRIEPYAPLKMDPGASVLHYAQECFEGLKAYRHADGSTWLFRPDANAERFQNSAKRLYLPELPIDDFIGSVAALVKRDVNWVPTRREYTLYMRPFMFASEPFLGVRAPQEMIVYLAQKGLEICSLQDDGMYKNTWKDNADQLAAAADVFQFYKDCIDSGVVDPNSKSFGYEETDDNFVNGFSASYVTGNWLQEKEDANPEVMSDVTVEPIPVPEGGTPATYMELKPLFLFNTSKNNDAAFDFATYVCGKEWQQDVYSSASPRSDVTVPGKWTEDFQALSDNGVAFPPVTLGSISQAMIDSIAKVLQEGMTPQAAAEWLADAVNTSLEESGELSAS